MWNFINTKSKFKSDDKKLCLFYTFLFQTGITHMHHQQTGLDFFKDKKSFYFNKNKLFKVWNFINTKSK